ncbi:hypothetical protein EJB05_15608, partial [Eragrostis curvula]
VDNPLQRTYIIPNKADASDLLRWMLEGKHVHPVTQIVINLPNDAADISALAGEERHLWEVAGARGMSLLTAPILGKLQNIQSGLHCVLPKIHVYGFYRAEDPEYDFHERINLALGENMNNVELHRCGLLLLGNGLYVHHLPFPNLLHLQSRITQPVEFVYPAYSSLHTFFTLSFNSSKQIS